MFGDKRRPTATIAAEIDRIIGLNIRRAREDVRLGQHEVATLLGISVHVLARYEEGQERAPAALLLELTKHVGCQLTDLFSGMPSMEAEDDFQGSRPSMFPVTEEAPRHSQPNPPQSFAEVAPPPAQAPAPHAPTPPAPALSGGGIKNDALALAKIIQAFSALESPVVRERLLGLLQALA